MKIWDYKINKNWRPKSDREWQWYLVRKINNEDLKGINKTVLKKYFPQIEKKLDKGKRELIRLFLFSQ